MFSNILLPLDGSHFGELALPLAAQVAKAADARLHIVRVHVATTTPAHAPPQWDLDELVREKEREHLAAALERAQTSGVNASTELLEGPIVAALERYIEALGIDLVVMSTHGRSGLTRAVLGSVAERCVRLSHVPVLLLHPRAADDDVPNRAESLKRILVALDGTPESETILAPVMEMAALNDARLTLVRVATAPFDIVATLGYEALQEYLRRARQQAAAYLEGVADRIGGRVPVSTLAVSADRAAAGIMNAQAEVGADLIAMATSGRSGWARIAIGSVAESVLHKSTTPVLMLLPDILTKGDLEEDMAGTASSN